MTRIVQDTHTCFGKPRLEGTRMPTIALWHCHEEGISIGEMIGPDYWPHLSREHVVAALEFERSIREPCGKVRDRAAYKLKNGRRLAPSCEGGIRMTATRFRCQRGGERWPKQ